MKIFKLETDSSFLLGQLFDNKSYKVTTMPFGEVVGFATKDEHTVEVLLPANSVFGLDYEISETPYALVYDPNDATLIIGPNQGLKTLSQVKENANNLATLRQTGVVEI